MGYRQVYIKKCKKLSLKNNSLCIIKDDEEEIVSIPLEDITSILIEDPFTVITTRLLTELSKYGITTFLCDETHLPNTQIISLNSHYNQLGVFIKQLELNKTIKQKIWQKLIKQKIKNQKLIIEYTQNDIEKYLLLESYEKTVELNDRTNREGIASKVYFTTLFGEDFIRFGSSNISGGLNYGYTIFHGATVRALILYGLHTHLGIWHSSSKNAFNLASDFIEPFRPLVDYFCFWNQNYLDKPLSSDNRKKIISLLNEKIKIGNKQYNVEGAIEIMVKSFLKVLETENANDLLLPEVMGANFIDEEYL